MENREIPTKESHPSLFTLDRYCSGELHDAAVLRDIDLHVTTCDRCASYIRKMSDDSVTITDRHPTLQSITAGKRNHSFFTRFISVPAFKPVFAALAVMVIIIPLALHQFNRNNTLFAKGSVSWYLFTGKKLYTSDDGPIICNPGDTVQLLTSAKGSFYCYVGYRDNSLPLKPYYSSLCTHEEVDSSPTPLPFSIVLDSMWRKQEILCFSSDEPVDSTAVAGFLEYPNDMLPPDISFATFILIRETR
jgi:hypothetical protein